MCATSSWPLISKLEAVRVNSPVDVSLEYDKSLAVVSLFLTVYWTPSIVIVLVSPPAKASAPSRTEARGETRTEALDKLLDDFVAAVCTPLFSL